METVRKARFITPVYGSAPAAGAQWVFETWQEDTLNKLRTFAEQAKIKGEIVDEAALRILSRFHRDVENGNGSVSSGIPVGPPIIGGWMLRKCLVNTGLVYFDARKNSKLTATEDRQPNKIQTPKAIQTITPFNILLQRSDGTPITKPDGIETYTVTTIVDGKPRSFFKAYEYIRAGAEFEFSIVWDDDLIPDKQMEWLLQKSGNIGVGAFRERFGKFKLI